MSSKRVKITASRGTPIPAKDIAESRARISTAMRTKFKSPQQRVDDSLFFKQFGQSFEPDEKQKAQLKAIVFHMYENVGHVSFIKANTSSYANDNYMICLGRTDSSPKVYFGVYEFIHGEIATFLQFDPGARTPYILDDAMKELGLKLELVKKYGFSRWVLKR